MNTRNLLHSCTYLLCAGLAALGGPARAMDPGAAANAQAAADAQMVAAVTVAALSAPASSPAASSSSSSAATGSIHAERLPTFDPASSSKAPGYAKMVGINLKGTMQKREAAKVGPEALESFSIGAKAAMASSHRMVAVATDKPEGKQHYLMLVDLDLLTDLRKESLVDYLHVPEYMPDTKWLSPDILLCASGKGNLMMYKYDSQKRKLGYLGSMIQASGSIIREMAVKPGTPENNIAIGGYDQKLNFLDLNRPDAAYVQRLDLQSVISSLRWAPQAGGAYLSATLDEGKFYMFDTRTRISESAIYLNARKLDLYGHERIGDFGVALGFGDGMVKLFDMRTANHIVQTFQDPHVDVVGGIEYEASSQQFLCSGYTDYSHWKRQPDDQVTLESHRDLGSNRLRGRGWACYSIFASPNEILTTTNAGELMVAYLEP